MSAIGLDSEGDWESAAASLGLKGDRWGLRLVPYGSTAVVMFGSACRTLDVVVVVMWLWTSGSSLVLLSWCRRAGASCKVIQRFFCMP